MGLHTVLLEAESAAGGQVYRAPSHRQRVVNSPDQRSGQALREALAQSGVEVLFGQTVWSVSGDYRVDILGPQGPVSLAVKGPHCCHRCA